MNNNVVIGRNPVVEDYVLLGVPPTHKQADKLIIGDVPIIRSHSVIYAGTRIGNNFQTGHAVLIREGNIIGDDVSIGSHTVLECENRIGNGVRIHSNCFIPEFVIIEDNAWIGPGTMILNVLHPPCPRFEDCARSVRIKRNAKIGGNVTIGPRVTIGENSLVGMGSVVAEDVPADAVVQGNPARVVKQIHELTCELGYFDTPYKWEER